MQAIFILLIFAQTFISSSACGPQFQKQHPRCGKHSATGLGLVTGGSNFPRGAWPWMVALYKINRRSEKYFCGGTFILERKVLTGK